MGRQGYTSKDKKSLVYVKFGKPSHAGEKCFGDRKCYKCGKTEHLSQFCWSKPSSTLVFQRRGHDVNEIVCREMLDTESFVVIIEEWDGEDPKCVNMASRKIFDERKSLHAKVSFGDKSKIIVLVDTGNIFISTGKNFCVYHGVNVNPAQEQLTQFNGSSSHVIGNSN